MWRFLTRHRFEPSSFSLPSSLRGGAFCIALIHAVSCQIGVLEKRNQPEPSLSALSSYVQGRLVRTAPVRYQSQFLDRFNSIAHLSVRTHAICRLCSLYVFRAFFMATGTQSSGVSASKQGGLEYAREAFGIKNTSINIIVHSSSWQSCASICPPFSCPPGR